MTVHQKNEESRETCFPMVSPCGKNNWPEMDNDSSSWDRNSRATSSSWPGDMEEAATRKVLQLWDAIERNLFGEVDEESFEPVTDECNQWRTQLTHLRIVGKCFASGVPQNSNNGSIRSASRRSRAEDRSGEEIIMEDSPDGYNLDDLNGTSRYPWLAKDQNEVFDQIFDFVYSELSKQEEKRETVSLSRDLDDVLRITPAPTYSGRKTMKSRKKRDFGGSRKSSANKNLLHASEVDADGDGAGENDRIVSATSRKSAKNLMENDGSVERDEPDVPQVARNKLGTVFNEKIVVSPVPFVVSQRESFTTLRTTPISFRAQTFEISTPQGLRRYMNSASKTHSGYRILQSHSAWQAPVCPTVWPKNIRLAPIDPSRLPSSKNRSSTDSSALPQRNRNSLSPISRPSKLVQSATLRDHNGEGLEIQGKQIIARSPKQNLLKTSSPRNAKSSRTKARTQKR